MTRALALLNALATVAWSHSSTPRVAVVKVADTYRSLDATARLDERVRRIARKRASPCCSTRPEKPTRECPLCSIRKTPSI